VRNFAAGIEHLLGRGHQVHLGFDIPDSLPTGIEERLAQRYPGLTWDEAPKRNDHWSLLLFALRGTIDLIRYAHPDYRKATALHQRISRRAGWYLGRLRAPLQLLFAVRSAWCVELAVNWLTWLQFKVPVAQGSSAYLKENAPDVVIVTPLVDFASVQVDHIQAADQLGIPTIAAIASWDNLTNKGLLRCRPDRVLVWNRPQQREAVRYHYIPESRITVTGAHTFDRWLGRKPLRSYEAFLTRVNLKPGADYVVFVCSSGFISRQEEVIFVRQWITAIRNSADSRLCDLRILVRPHFQNALQWAGVDFCDLGNVAIYPSAGANPVDQESEEDFFDTLYYARAVVGLNTTAMIEAGLIGRPVMTIETAQFSSTQSGSLHFQHLREGGLLKYADTMEAHLKQLAGTLDQPPHIDANRAFIDYFIRPPNGDCSAIERLVTEIEAVAEMEKAPRRPGWTDQPLQGFLFYVAKWLHRRKRSRELLKAQREISVADANVDTGRPPTPNLLRRDVTTVHPVQGARHMAAKVAEPAHQQATTPVSDK
jgi:hypothetical protein